MTENMRVRCLVNPKWDIGTKSYIWDEADCKEGILIGLTSEIYNGSMTAVGVVVIESNETMQQMLTVPIQFMKQIKTNV